VILYLGDTDSESRPG